MSPRDNILLESGTNELEVLVFRVGEYTLGINVAKVREVLPSQQITCLPKSHPTVLGCFTLRQVVVPCVSLHRYLGQPEPLQAEGRMILAEFNQHQTAFVVDEVERIHRISWEKVQAIPMALTSSRAPVTAVTNINGRLISMLDFETITADIADRHEPQTAVANPHEVPRGRLHVLLADDSPTVRRNVQAMLEISGYGRVTSFGDGRALWEYIEQRYRELGEVSAVADLVISDVEMPHMDGLHVTRRIKEHPQLRALPVLLFSSILTPDNQRKGAAVGADAQVTKPEVKRVVELADQLIARSAAAEGTVQHVQLGA